MTTRSRRSRQPPAPTGDAVTDYRYPETRKNNPPAGLAAQGRITEVPKQRYSYDPHLPPVLRFDGNGKSDQLPELLQTARQRALTAEEAQLLADALSNHQPWLEWAGKRDKRWFEVDPVALHIHERVSAQAILKIAARQDVQRSLWGDPEQEYREAVQFYQHDVDWANRLILGDSLAVMNSLAKREDLAGKVQMIYIDPPYGIKFSSNFQPTIGNRDVKDREQDLTREPEMVKAYRDTWTLGVHSYLAYLRDRLYAAKELLADSGSIFVQISDENLHRVRAVMDEVFGPTNQVTTISYMTSIGLGSKYLDAVTNYLLWYAKDKDGMKYHPLFRQVRIGEEGATRYRNAQNQYGEERPLSSEESGNPDLIPNNWRPFFRQGLTSRSGSDTTRFPVSFQGREYRPTAGGWRTNLDGMRRLKEVDRIVIEGNRLTFRKMFDDFGCLGLTNFWADVGGGVQSRTDPKVYVTQTTTSVIERCVLMTTDPGDLVLDPTCGGGTTAYVAEQWGRRWITIDTSRVGIALARQRLLTAKFPYFKTRDGSNQLHAKSFFYETVPHIELGKSIAQNVALDSIFARWEPILKDILEMLNLALEEVTPEVRSRLLAKLAEKERREGRRATTEADRRRWVLPKEGWAEWEVPFDTDPDWPELLKEALLDYREAWRAKMAEVNACIAASAEQEELVDQPEVERGVVRVAGPFTVEAVQPAEESLDLQSPIGGDPASLETFEVNGNVDAPANAEAYLDKMIRLLRNDGVRFPDNKAMKFISLAPLSGNADWLHAEGEWASEGNGETPRRVAISFGPQYGPVTTMQVEECIRAASQRGYNDLVFAGFSFDGAAQAAIQEDPNPRVRIHLAHICPDVNANNEGLLKDTRDSQLFTVFGLPRTELRQTEAGEWLAEMQGVDIYNPVDNTIVPTGADKVAAWFVDSDYDGRTFCICQAFFPDRSAWDRLARALKGVTDEDKFAAFSGTVSLPFPVGTHKRVAVKVIDPRGNEVMRVHSLEEVARYG